MPKNAPTSITFEQFDKRITRELNLILKIQDGAEDVRYDSKSYRPERLEIRFTQNDDEPLRIDSLSLSGLQRLKSGALSEVTYLGSYRGFHDASTVAKFRAELAYQAADGDQWLAHTRPLPDWVADLVEFVWPNPL